MTKRAAVIGIALAIELAAGRLDSLSPTELSALCDRLSLISLGRRSAPERHRSLTAALDWGYTLLSETERTLATIWKELLPPGKIDARTHFLRAGGSSLLALHVASVVRRRLRRALSPVDVLRHPVLSDQAHAIDQSNTVVERPDELDDALVQARARAANERLVALVSRHRLD